MTAAESVDITRELARGKFTDEMLNDMRARIGLELRTDALHRVEIPAPVKATTRDDASTQLRAASICAST